MRSLQAKQLPGLDELRLLATVAHWIDEAGFTYVRVDTFLETAGMRDIARKLEFYRSQVPNVVPMMYFFDLKPGRVRSRRLTQLQRDEDRKTDLLSVTFDREDQMVLLSAQKLDQSTELKIPAHPAWKQEGDTFHVRYFSSHRVLLPKTHFKVLYHLSLKGNKKQPRGIVLVQRMVVS